MTARFPLLHGVPGTIARAYTGKAGLAPILAVLATLALVASGVDDAVRDFFVASVPLGGTETRFAQLMISMTWPIFPALWLARRGVHEKDRELLAGGCAILQAVIVIGVLTTIVKIATGRPQPESVEPARAFYGLSLDNTRTMRVMWPSGHTTESFGAAGAIVGFWPGRRRLALVAYGFATLVGAIMVVSSFHWLSDVVAATFLAAPLGWSTGATLRRWVGDMKTFRLNPSTTLVLDLGDITRAQTDAIVNAANEWMLGGGGVDGAIHRAAGGELVAACKKEPEVRPGVRCPTGEARITPGFKLPAKHVIHTVGPIYESAAKSAPLLASAYRSSLELAKKNGLRSVSFPAISCGVFGYPLDEGAAVAIETCRESAAPPIAEVRFVLFSQDVFDAWVGAARSILTGPPRGS